MPVQHCAICGQLLPDDVQAEAEAAGDEQAGALPKSSSPQREGAGGGTAAVPVSSSICVLCQGKLRSSLNAAHTTHTTVLRPAASERLAGQVLVPKAEDQGEAPAGLIVPEPAKGEMPEPSPSASSLPQGEGDAGETLGLQRGSSISPNRPLGESPLPVAQHFGSYEIISEISRGSFGVVYRAKQQGLDRVVALKVLLAGAYASNEMVARFQREAKAVARLKHPNVVPVYDIGTHEGHHFFAMEFVEGSALSDLIAKHAITTQRALEIAEALADALECAHRAGVIHRDIKPSNIIVDAHGSPHITDFGLAKQVDLDEKYTLSGTTLGTPAYMPPEQARGEINRIDARSDEYAIGAVLYEMLTGRTPFVGRSLLEVVVAVINEPAQPPRQLNQRIHRDVQTIVLKCLEKDPDLRYSSAAELRDDIRRFRSGEAIRAKPAGLIRHTTRFLRRHSVLVAAVALVCLVTGFSVYRSNIFKEEKKKLVDDRKKAEDKVKKLMASQETRWLPDWWFPPRDPKELANEEQRKLYQVPEGKEQLFKRFGLGNKDGWDLQVQKVRFRLSGDSLASMRAAGVAEPVLSKLNALKSREFETEQQLSQELTRLLDRNELERFQSQVLKHAKVKDDFEVVNRTVRLKGSETLVSPEECRSFGDVDAGLVLELAGWNAEKKLRIGIQSLAGGYDGIPYVVEIGGGSIRLVGPVDLFTYTSQGEAAKGPSPPPRPDGQGPPRFPGEPPFPPPKKGREGPRLEVKAEKDAPELKDGRYALSIFRRGMELGFQLNGLDGQPGAGLKIVDLNLSNWVFKNTQLVVRQPEAGMQVKSAEVKHKYGGKEGDAFTHFHEGEYNAAEQELKAITERGEPNEDYLDKARAHHLLGLLREMLQPGSGRELSHYTNALIQLGRLRPEEQAKEVALAKELHLRRLLYYARSRDWGACMQEMRSGWGQEGKIGEPLAWDLDAVLQFALREPSKDAAAEDVEKAPNTQVAQMVFERLGLAPGSAVLGSWAVALANKLNSGSRFTDLLALRDAYPSHMLNKPFYDAVNLALKPDPLGKPGQFEKALVLLGKMDDRTEADAILKTRATGDALEKALETHRYAEVVALFAGRPNLQLLTMLCRDIEAQAKDLAAQAENDAAGNDRLNLFLFKVPRAIWAKLPSDPSAVGMFRDALEKVAPEVVRSGRVMNLVKLHECLRGAERQDPRMAKSFADAVLHLAGSEEYDAERKALHLLEYCSAHVERENMAVQNAVVAFAERRVKTKEPLNQDLILHLQAAYPTAGLLTKLAGDVLLALQDKGRYEDIIAFFAQARIEFRSKASVLTPYVINALGHLNSLEQRATSMADLWGKVHAELEQRQLAADERQWQLQYADIELVLNNWDKARERYLGLYNLAELEPDLKAQAGLRLGVLNLAIPTVVGASDPLLALLSMDSLPEYKLAAMLLAAPEKLRIADLDARLKEINAPLLLSPAEWDLFRGLRLKTDGNEAAAREAFAAAEQSAGPSRWVYSVASHLLRPAPDENPKSRVPNSKEKDKP